MENLEFKSKITKMKILLQGGKYYVLSCRRKIIKNNKGRLIEFMQSEKQKNIKKNKESQRNDVHHKLHQHM